MTESGINVPVVSVSRIGGLSDIVTGNTKLRPQRVMVDKDGNETSAGDYLEPTFPNSKEYLTPEFSTITKKWSFSGDVSTLRLIVRQLGLRYPNSHPKAGALIEVEDNINLHLGNMNDPIFTHADFYPGFLVRGGRGHLAVDSDVKHLFYYHCFKGRRDFVDETEETVNSRLTPSRAGASYKMTAPRRKNLHTRTKIDKKIEAQTQLGRISTNAERLRAICVLANIPGYSTASNLDGMVVLLDSWLDNDGHKKTQGSVTNYELFTLFCKMPNDELKFEYDVRMGIKKGIIRMGKNSFYFQGETVEGPNTFPEVVLWFKQEGNIDKFIELSTLLDSFDMK